MTAATGSAGRGLTGRGASCASWLSAEESTWAPQAPSRSCAMLVAAPFSKEQESSGNNVAQNI